MKLLLISISILAVLSQLPSDMEQRNAELESANQMFLDYKNGQLLYPEPYSLISDTLIVMDCNALNCYLDTCTTDEDITNVFYSNCLKK